MVSVETNSLHQKCVLWSRTGFDSNGEPVVSYPVEISCRWEDVTREISGEDNTPITIDAMIWTGQDITKGSMLWKGALTDLPSPATAVMEVVGFDATPDIKGRLFERVVYASRYKESLPTVA
jgi:hypothetical protein